MQNHDHHQSILFQLIFLLSLYTMAYQLNFQFQSLNSMDRKKLFDYSLMLFVSKSMKILSSFSNC